MFRFLALFPLPVVHGLARLATMLLLLVPNRHRHVTWINIRLCFPESSWFWRVALTVTSLGESVKGMAELGHFWRRTPDRTRQLIKSIENVQLLDEAIAQRRPVLIAAPHVGAWELLNLYLASRKACTFLYRERGDAGMEALVKAARERSGASLVQGDRLGLRRVLRELTLDGLVGVLPDHQPQAGNGIFAEFFGQPALTMALFSKLVQRCRPVVLFAVAERLSFGRGFRIHFHRPDASIYDDDLTASVRAMNRSVEVLARRFSKQYIWSYKRFSIQPGDRLSPY